MKAPAKTDGDTRIAPDPFAAVLPALAALGAVASIAAVNWVAQERTPDRAKSKRKAGAALRDLERCCLQLQDVFRGFHRSPKLFAGEGGTVTSPLKFGVHGVRASPEAIRLYQQLINDIASMLVLATQSAFDVMAAIEDGEIEVPEELFFGLAEQQERLNALIQQRATLKLSVETGYSVAVQLTKLVSAVREQKVD